MVVLWFLQKNILLCTIIFFSQKDFRLQESLLENFIHFIHGVTPFSIEQLG